MTRFTTDREDARAAGGLELMGIDQPLIQRLLRRWREVTPEDLGAAVQAKCDSPSVVTWWLVQAHGPDREFNVRILKLAVDAVGNRVPSLEQAEATELLRAPADPPFNHVSRARLLGDVVEPMVYREAAYRGIGGELGGISTRLIGWIECI